MANYSIKSQRELSFGISDSALELVMAYIDDPRDRDAVSLVCRRWYEIDGLTRKHVTIDLCYTTTAERLRQRFPHLESLKLKGKPRAAIFEIAKFSLVPEDWGGYVAPWIKEISDSEGLNCLKSLHFRRMIVKDKDLEILSRSRGHILEELKLDYCSGFSTDGLLHVARSCRCLRTFFLEESRITENDGDWLHELALNNTGLETLNFMTDLNKISIQDLEMIARNCHSLVSIKISDCEILGLIDFFRAASALEEFCGGTFNKESANYSAVLLPHTLRSLGLNYIARDELHIVFPISLLLKKLNLLYSLLDTEGHCQLIQRCPNLEVLVARDVIGNRGLLALSQSCKRLRRLRIEVGADDEGTEDDELGPISQRGLSALAQGCPKLEYVAIYVFNVTNAALEVIGTHCKNLRDFRLVLVDREDVTDLPLDNGVRALLIGCQKLRRFGLFTRAGGLTDVGLRYIGQYSLNVKSMILGGVGESDTGLLEFSKGCLNLQKLEIRGCCFSEHALSLAVMQLTSLRYFWLQGYRASSTGSNLLAMVRPFWNIELKLSRWFTVTNADGAIISFEDPVYVLAYYSLAGQRTDYPDTVVPLTVKPTTF